MKVRVNVVAEYCSVREVELTEDIKTMSDLLEALNKAEEVEALPRKNTVEHFSVYEPDLTPEMKERLDEFIG